jgi:hypothetical protein
MRPACAPRCLLPLLLLTGLACQARDLEICDITQTACQEAIYYRVLNLRGDAYDPFGGIPPVVVISEDRYRQQLIDDQAKADEVGPSPWTKALRLLHFTVSQSGLPDGGADGGDNSGDSTIEDQVQHVYAIYDQVTKTITVISHPSQSGDSDREMAMVTLAHELVHALQDREQDLQREDFETTDDYFSWDAMIEGDARFYEYLFENGLFHLGYSQPNIVQMPDYELGYVYDHYEQAGAPLFAARLLVYPLGAKYLAMAYRDGGNAAVRHAYAKAPKRTVGLLVGEDGRAPPTGTGDVCPAPYVRSLPTSGKTAGADQFGALLFYTFLRGWNVDHETAFAAAQSWTGDFLRIQVATDFSTTAAAWRVELSTQPPPSVMQALSATGELTVTGDARSLQISVTDAKAPLDWASPGGCR